MKNKTIKNELIFSKKMLEIAKIKLEIPKVKTSPAKYRTDNLTPKILNNRALKR